MKISCNRLKKYIKDSNQIDFISIWDPFTIRVAEVENIEIKGNDIENVVVAKIVECKTHPTKDKYHVLKVDNGERIINILCGAPNVYEGMIVPLVNVGGKLGEFTIESKEIAGFLSEGMLLAMDELSIGEDHSGIMDLPKDWIIGKPLKEYLPIEDIIVEIDNKSLTNRPDLWGHYGIAREIAAITNHELLPLDVEELDNNKEDLDIKILHDYCLRYVGLKIDNINENETPYAEKIFLYYVGMRSISLVVDLTNIIMLELGMPMHAFDANYVKKIEVGLANTNDKFITLDGVERTLTNENLMIKSNNEYYAIAGVMGGKESEIASETSSIILESAVFNATSVRKTATYLGLRTEASSRFEKSLDPNLCETVIKRFVKLLKDVDSSVVVGSNLTDHYKNKLTCPKIILHKDKLAMYMGKILNDEEVVKILEALAFELNVMDDCYEIIVPSFRATKDISIEEDIVEEISRIYGYENIEPVPLRVELLANMKEIEYENIYDLKNYLSTKYNLNEVHTYLWEKTNVLNKLGVEENNPKIIGKTEDNTLRKNMLGSLIDVIINNSKKKDKIGVYEIGTIIDQDINKRVLSIMLMNDDKEINKIYYNLKEIINNIFASQKNININFKPIELSDLYHNQLSLGIFIDHEQYGYIGVLEKTFVKKKCIIYCQIDMEKFLLLTKADALYERQSRYPVVELDYTIVTPKDFTYNQVDSVINKFTNDILMKYEFSYLFENEMEKKFTFRYTVGLYDRTLTGEDLEKFKQTYIKYIRDNNLEIIE